MPTSLSEAKAQLLKGAPLSWKKFETYKAGSITLETAGARRLFNFLSRQTSSKVAEASEQLFPGLIAAWTATDDPADAHVTTSAISTADIWRLARIEAGNFGGLTTFEGPSFDMTIGRENWCLEGQNGSGKTSLSNAILWAMTGKRVREQDGLIEELGTRAPVNNSAGKEIGTWPPIVSYPKTATDLAKEAIGWVRLTFENEKGEQAFAERKVISPKEGAPTLEVSVDNRLTAVPQLIETGLLMPARIPRIGFGDKSQSLYEGVKLLTGLDQLADIADGAGKFGNKAQRFYKYAKDQGIDAIEAAFTTNIGKAEIHAKTLGMDISGFQTPGQKELDKSLMDAAKLAETQASDHIATLKSEIAEGLDTSIAAVRKQVKQAVESARAIAKLGVSGTEADDICLDELLQKISALAGHRETFSILALEDDAARRLEMLMPAIRQLADESDGVAAEWIGRGVATIVRLAGVLSLMEWAETGIFSMPVGAAHIEAAHELWSGYYLPHALAVFDRADAGARSGDHAARRVVRWLKRVRAPQISREEVRREALCQSVDADGAEEVLARLEAGGFLRPLAAGGSSKGGPRRRRWEVNPAVGAVSATPLPPSCS